MPDRDLEVSRDLVNSKQDRECLRLWARGTHHATATSPSTRSTRWRIRRTVWGGRRPSSGDLLDRRTGETGLEDEPRVSGRDLPCPERLGDDAGDPVGGGAVRRRDEQALRFRKIRGRVERGVQRQLLRKAVEQDVAGVTDNVASQVGVPPVRREGGDASRAATTTALDASAAPHRPQYSRAMPDKAGRTTWRTTRLAVGSNRAMRSRASTRRSRREGSVRPRRASSSSARVANPDRWGSETAHRRSATLPSSDVAKPFSPDRASRKAPCAMTSTFSSPWARAGPSERTMRQHPDQNPDQTPDAGASGSVVVVGHR